MKLNLLAYKASMSELPISPASFFPGNILTPCCSAAFNPPHSPNRTGGQDVSISVPWFASFPLLAMPFALFSPVRYIYIIHIYNFHLPRLNSSTICLRSLSSHYCSCSYPVELPLVPLSAPNVKIITFYSTHFFTCLSLPPGFELVEAWNTTFN